jgi:hypothetical protein
MDTRRQFMVTEPGMKAIKDKSEKPDWEGIPKPGTRAAICRYTGLSMSTVSAILQGLPVGERTAAVLITKFGKNAVTEKESLFKVV